MFTDLGKQTLFDHLYFIPAGTVVDAVTVDIDNWPDNTPTTNYDPFKLKYLEGIKPFRNTDSETDITVSETAAGYEQQDSETIKNDGFTYTTPNMNTLYKMLEKGLEGLPVAGTAYTPRANKNNYRDGVLLQLTGDQKLAVITEREWCWARVALVNPGEHNNKTAKIEVRITKMDAANNSYVLVDLEA